MKTLIIAIALMISLMSHANVIHPTAMIFKSTVLATKIEQSKLISVAIKIDEIVIAFYSDIQGKVVIEKEDLGIDRINDFIIREIKNKNRSKVTTPNPITINQVQQVFQFISNQLANMFSTELREKLRKKEVTLHFDDSSFSGDLKDFVAFSNIDLMTDQILFNSILNSLGLSDSILKSKGFKTPQRDVTRMMLAYALLNNFGVYSASIKSLN